MPVCVEGGPGSVDVEYSRLLHGALPPGEVRCPRGLGDEEGGAVHGPSQGGKYIEIYSDFHYFTKA